jgi:hypothetical protein
VSIRCTFCASLRISESRPKRRTRAQPRSQSTTGHSEISCCCRRGSGRQRGTTPGTQEVGPPTARGWDEYRLCLTTPYIDGWDCLFLLRKYFWMKWGKGYVITSAFFYIPFCSRTDVTHISQISRSWTSRLAFAFLRNDASARIFNCNSVLPAISRWRRLGLKTVISQSLLGLENRLESEECRLLRFHAVWLLWEPTFRRNMSPPSSEWQE